MSGLNTTRPGLNSTCPGTMTEHFQDQAKDASAARDNDESVNEETRPQARTDRVHDIERSEDAPPQKRIRITSAVSGDQLFDIDAEDSWDITRLKHEIKLLTGTAIAHQHITVDDKEIQNGDALATLWRDTDNEFSETVTTVRLLKVSWVVTLSINFPEIYELSSDLGVSDRAGCITQLLGDEWLQCSMSGPLSSVVSTPDYFVAFKMEIAESWRQTRHWGQILLFTANGFPEWEEYPFRCPDFVLECDGDPRLLVIVSNHDDDNQHISRRGLACTDYDLPTGVELSVMLAVAGDLAAVYIDGKEVCRGQVGRREAHECLQVYPNPPDVGWISAHGYEVPNRHVRIRELVYVSFPTQ